MRPACTPRGGTGSRAEFWARVRWGRQTRFRTQSTYFVLAGVGLVVTGYRAGTSPPSKLHRNLTQPCRFLVTVSAPSTILPDDEEKFQNHNAKLIKTIRTDIPPEPHRNRSLNSLQFMCLTLNLHGFAIKSLLHILTVQVRFQIKIRLRRLWE